jgi:hypothetical protein
MGALAAVLLILIGSLPRTAATPPPVAVATSPAAATSPSAGEEVARGSMPADADTGRWDVMAELVGTLDWETAGAAGLSVVPGDSEHAAMLLTPEEQAELSRLLRGELARSKS